MEGGFSFQTWHTFPLAVWFSSSQGREAVKPPAPSLVGCSITSTGSLLVNFAGNPVDGFLLASSNCSTSAIQRAKTTRSPKKVHCSWWQRRTVLCICHMFVTIPDPSHQMLLLYSTLPSHNDQKSLGIATSSLRGQKSPKFENCSCGKQLFSSLDFGDSRLSWFSSFLFITPFPSAVLIPLPCLLVVLACFQVIIRFLHSEPSQMSQP